jgi:hypothetical protein
LIRLAVLLLSLLIAALLPATRSTLLPQAQTATAQDTEFNTSLFQNGWTGDDEHHHSAIATADYDNDGDLDIAVARNGVFANTTETPSVVLYANENGTPGDDPVWSTSETEGFRTSALAWADYDKDGDFDLLVGVVGDSNRLYRNDNGTLTTTPHWTSDETDETRSVAWGDMNGDGWLDLAVGNGCNLDSLDSATCAEPNRVYLNQNGTLETTASWQSDAALSTASVAWGDVNNDGRPDLAVGNGGNNYDGDTNQVHLNQNGTLETTASWQSTEAQNTTSVAWADMTNDGQLELLVGNTTTNQTDHANRIYQFTITSGTIASATAIWQSNIDPLTQALLPADYNNDGKTDLAVITTEGENNGVYTFEIGTNILTDTLIWKDRNHENSAGGAWADIDNDGDLDLFTAGHMNHEPVRLYTNTDSYFADTAVSSLNFGPFNKKIPAAWGDVDNDGDLDLAVGGSDAEIYTNSAGTLSATPAWSLDEQDVYVGNVAWGDVNNDGWLDLAISGETSSSLGYTRVYLNNGAGTLASSPSWPFVDTETTSNLDALTWVDFDGDGDIDLSGVSEETIDGRSHHAVRIYHTTDNPTRHQNWKIDIDGQLETLAWGDMNGDGRLDLAMGYRNGYNKVYGFVDGDSGPEPEMLWKAPNRHSTRSIAWGDYNSDGLLDLVMGCEDGLFLYENTAGQLGDEIAWEAHANFVFSVAWYDLGSDGDLDLVTSNGIFLNDNGSLSTEAMSIPNNWVNNLLLADADNDGDLDALTIEYSFGTDATIQLYHNQRDNRGNPNAPPAAVLSWANIPDDNANGRAYGYHAAPWRAKDKTAITFNLFHPESLPAQAVHGFYSLDGGGTWHNALRLEDSSTNVLTGTLESRPYGTIEAANTHTFTWDTWASGFFGQSEDVIFSLLVVPSITTKANSIAGPYHYGSYGASTVPVRAEGTPLIVNQNGEPAEGAYVYRLPADELQAIPFASDADEPLRTDQRGQLRSSPLLSLDDQLIAVHPISSTDRYTYYLTSARPTSRTLEGDTVGDRIIQELEVTYPLLIFDLDVSLEWDASDDQQYIEQLTDDLKSASSALYDWTDGQVALGTITVYQNRDRWNEADVRIYASNRLRPNADQGGIVTEQLAETVLIDGVDTLVTYNPGQIRMGYTWNRYGNSEGTIGEDWPRALAHEIGHYALYLNDNYISLDSSTGAIEYNTSCRGAMFDPYLNNNSEFYPTTGWEGNCSNTLSEQQTGRSDWETILKFYDQSALGFSLNEPAAFANNTGPVKLSLAITNIVINSPITSTEGLGTPIIYTVDSDGQPLSPDRSARALLYQGNRVLDLGRVTSDQVTVLGGNKGDEFCVYDLVSDPPLLGCDELANSTEQLTLLAVPDSQNWPPNLVLDFPDATTVQIQVVDAPNDATLMAQVFPIDAEASGAITLSDGQGEVSLESAAESGYVRVWVDEKATDSTPRRETITDYRLQGNLSTSTALSTHSDTRNAELAKRPGSGSNNSSKAPVYSSDGQATLYGLELEFLPGEFYALQSTNAPAPPSWATPVGRAYRLTATNDAPKLAGNVGITLSYLENEVIDGHEAWLKMYYWDDTASSIPTWQVLTSTTDFERNLVSAPTQGPGRYVLMSSFEVALTGSGWNHIGYPIRGAPRAVEEALASIKGAFDSVWHYNATTPEWEAWSTFNVSAPEWASDLTTLEFGEGYWISMTQEIDTPLYLKGPPDPEDETTTMSQRAATSEFSSTTTSVPALYYAVLDSSWLTATAGMQIQARINGTLCGASETQLVNGKVAFYVKVVADTPGGIAGCGAAGHMVDIELDAQPYATVRWENRQAINIGTRPVYLPLVMR